MNNRVKDLGRGLSVIVCSVVLSACALPVPFQIASWAIDGISFIATDKSIADHGLSLVAQKDCAMWRGLKGEDICSDYDDADTFAVASADSPLSDSPSPQQQPPAIHSTPDVPEVDVAALAEFETAVGSPEIAPPVVNNAKPEQVKSERLMIAGNRVWSASLDADLYFVIGSFSNRNNARRLVGKYQQLGPAVMASRLDGIEVYRVAVGPFTADQKRQMRLSLKQAGIGNAWAMRIDQGSWTLASPKLLTSPDQSIAQAPAQSPVVTPLPDNVTSDEIAETPDDALRGQGLSSELIDNNRHHLVIGSFSNAQNASNYAKSKAAFSPRILSVETTEGWRHRVVIGPYVKAERLVVRRVLAGLGIENIWALNMKPDTITDDTMLSDVINAPYLPDAPVALEVAESPAPAPKSVVFKNEIPAAASNQKMSWGVNLVEYIFDMFRSTDTTDVVGVVAPLET
jgi:cell division protein FtsN